MAALDEIIRRYENKYIIDRSLCERIEDYISFFCVPDRYADKKTGEYTIHSLYFDTPNLSFFEANMIKAPVRIKARARYFGGKPADYLWLEIKRKIKNVIVKERHRIDVAKWPEILNMVSPDSNATNVKGLIRNERSLDSFLNIVDSFGAVPAAHVRYIRKAYVSQIDRYVRITFDRRLSGCLAYGNYDLNVSSDDLISIDDPGTCDFNNSAVVLEIKCEVVYPRWIEVLVQKFRLFQQGFSKYCHTIEHAFSDLRGERDILIPTRKRSQIKEKGRLHFGFPSLS